MSTNRTNSDVKTKNGIDPAVIAPAGANGGSGFPPPSNGLIVALSLLMFLVALAVALAHRSLNMEATLALFLVAFSLALVGALVLFHLLSSTAQINRTSYKLGGAAAGFVILLVLFYKLLGVPFANENKLYRLATDEDTDRYIQIADDKTRVKRLKSPWLNKIAEDTLLNAEYL